MRRTVIILLKLVQTQHTQQTKYGTNDHKGNHGHLNEPEIFLKPNKTYSNRAIGVYFTKCQNSNGQYQW